MGYRPFREEVAAYLRTARAVRCEADQVMVVSGSQHALELTARVLLEAGNPVWVEQPGYGGARDVLRLRGAKLTAVPVDSEGLNVAAGIERCPRARAAYVTPSHQYPMGMTMSASRRLQLLDWAHRNGSWVVEDDYDSEYRYENLPIASLQGLDRDSRVLYIGTFSKVLLRPLGYEHSVAGFNIGRSPSRLYGITGQRSPADRTFGLEARPCPTESAGSGQENGLSFLA